MNRIEAPPKILVVDDEPELREILSELLRDEFFVVTAENGKEALLEVARSRPDLILLDLLMPVMDGLTMIQHLRADDQTRGIPVVLLTALGSVSDRVRAFDSGADDFITKPFQPEEVLSRIRARLRRTVEIKGGEAARVSGGGLDIQFSTREVFLHQRLLVLAPSEFGILTLLARNEGRVVSRLQIMKEVWGDQAANDRLIDAHLTSLRKKISGFSGELKTVYGGGFRLRLNIGTEDQS